MTVRWWTRQVSSAGRQWRRRLSWRTKCLSVGFRHKVSKKRTGQKANAHKPGTVVMFPGLSLMQAVQLRPDALFVRCPGCGASATFTTAKPPRAFGHEDDSCPVLLRIQAAMSELQGAIAAEVGQN